MEPEDDDRSPLETGRVGRALALMAVSVLAIGVATVAYAHPQLSAGPGKQTTSPPVVASYQVSTLDFVDDSTGWVVADLPTHDFAVLHTVNAGRSWTRQLVGPAGEIGEYARFFDTLDGVLVLLGPQAAMFQTRDGGKTWDRAALPDAGGNVVSAEFVDSRHGWLLVQVRSDQHGMPTETLYRTSDGGTTWADLGDPVIKTDWAFRVVFADWMRGWLYSRSSAATAYATIDGGASWRRVALPAPHGNWPVAPAGATTVEQFFVAARPTFGSGVVVVVVAIAPPQRRSADGSVLIGYPPLTVRGFDGGGAIIYRYRTLVDASPSGASAIAYSSQSGQASAVPDADQIEMSSADGGATWHSISAPLSGGAIGYAGARDWWWVGEGTWSTTSDAGVTWTPARNIGVVAPVPGSLQILDMDHAWFAGMAGNRPLLETTDDGGYEWRMILLPPITKS